MNLWDNLPNAAHIDRVLASVKANPQAWGAALDAARGAAWDAARGAALDAARGAALDAAWDAAWDAARDAALDAARDAALGAACGAVRGAAWDALLALVAWDDCAGYLSTPPEAFPLLLSTDNHAARLLHPAAIVFSKESI